MIYARTCGCGREVTYKSEYTWKKAKANSSMCPSCRTSHNNKLPQRALKASSNPAWKGYKDVPGKVLSKLKRGAETRKLSFNISLEDIQEKLEQQEYRCALTGWKVSFWDNASVDRIDSNKGYSFENIQIVDKRVNMAKRDFNNDFFINMCKAVSYMTEEKP